MYPVHPHQIITDAQYDSFVEHGYLILNEFIRGEELAMLRDIEKHYSITVPELPDDLSVLSPA